MWNKLTNLWQISLLLQGRRDTIAVFPPAHLWNIKHDVATEER